MSLDPRAFRKTLGCFPTGVTVVTTSAADGSPVGVTVSSFTSLSLDPPLVLFCLDHKSDWLGAFRQNSHFGVNVLRQEQRELSIRFGSKIGERWKGVPLDRGASGVPFLQGCLATLECAVTNIVAGGDHEIFIGQVEHLTHSEAGDPLVYFRGAYANLGFPV